MGRGLAKSKKLNLLIAMLSLPLFVGCGQYAGQDFAVQPNNLHSNQQSALTASSIKDLVSWIHSSDSSEMSSSEYGLPKGSVAESGSLTSTVYYTPIINEDEGLCKASDKVKLHGDKGQTLFLVCPVTAHACDLQGACFIEHNQELHRLNIIDKVYGTDHYAEIGSDGCQFGYGIANQCLDPFYSVAADLSVYAPGDVIFIPALIGLVLPDGSKHTGYMVVRDRGRGISGKGRFDIFTGHLGWRDQENPFLKLKLEDPKTRLPYFKIKGPLADKVRAMRASTQPHH